MCLCQKRNSYETKFPSRRHFRPDLLEGDEFPVSGRRLLGLFRRPTTGEKRPSSGELSARSSFRRTCTIVVIEVVASSRRSSCRLFRPLTADGCKERATQPDVPRHRRSDAIQAVACCGVGRGFARQARWCHQWQQRESESSRALSTLAEGGEPHE